MKAADGSTIYVDEATGLFYKEDEAEEGGIRALTETQPHVEGDPRIIVDNPRRRR